MSERLNSDGKEGKEQLSRRDFLGRCAFILPGVTIVGIAAPLLSSCAPSANPTNPGTVATGLQTFDVSSLTSDSQGLLTQIKGSDNHTIMIVRISQGEYVALSTRCTHQACDVDLPHNGSIICPCHGSRFSLTGQVLTGPAPSSLRSYQLTYDSSAQTVDVTVT